MVTIKTNHGDIKLTLDTENTPKTAENFLAYAKEGFYDGTIFHRVIDGFMIQGGGMDKDMNEKDSKEPVINEANLGKPNKRGTIAMARTSAPHSASSQFFINVKDNDFLNHTEQSMHGWGYCAFGEVTEGMDVVDSIKQVKTGGKNGHQDVPVDPVVIESITITEE